ncbi:MAG: hypothetical protein JO296_07590 [Pseudonocardiales bacterium]|nr:hypothetical protein [Pseudonocardiales bacterium]MBV9649983.1 hypothetical protein [Pseudonocardiales bacterium]
MRLTVILLLAAVGFLVAALRAGHVELAWASVALCAVVAALILRRARRSWVQSQEPPDDELVLLDDQLMDAEVGEMPRALAPAAARKDKDPAKDCETGSAPTAERDHHEPIVDGESSAEDDQPGEEDTDAADLLIIYELADEVLVVDESPRYHLGRCPWPDHERAERLPVREARQLGFTPCDRCRPDTMLARKHRAARATTSTAATTSTPAEPRKSQ